MPDVVPTQAMTAIDDFLAACDWADFAGPVVAAAQLQRLIDTDAPAWICVDFTHDGPDYPPNTNDLLTAINAADCVIIVRDIDKTNTAIGVMAAAGVKVLVFERPDGVPSPELLLDALI